MYNSQKVIDLLKERGLKKKQLVSYLNYPEKAGIGQVLTGDIRVSKIEKVADFFGVPIDAFFDREVKVDLVEYVNDQPADDTSAQLSMAYEREKVLRSLIEEKDRRIELLEELVAMYKNQAKSGDEK